MKEIKKKKGKRRWTRDDTDLTLISLPTFIWFVLFSYLPMFGIIIAFKDYKLSPGHGFIYNLLHSDWVGWSNFTYFFKSNAFWMLLRNTIVYNLVFIALGAAVAVGFALILDAGKIFYSDFGLFYQATGGIPASLYNVASTFDTYIYKAIQSSAPIGKTAAASFFQSVCCCATILLTNWLVKKVDEDSAII